MSHVDYEPTDRGKICAVAQWLGLPVVVFLVMPSREGAALRLTAALAVPVIMFF